MTILIFLVNQDNFKNFMGKYDDIGNYMLKNAKDNALNALDPAKVGCAVYKCLRAKNPKCAVNVGIDAHICAFASRFLSENLLNNIIRVALKVKLR